MGDCEKGFWMAFWLIAIIGWTFIVVAILLSIFHFINTKGWEFWIDSLVENPVESLFWFIITIGLAIWIYWTHNRPEMTK